MTTRAHDPAADARHAEPAILVGVFVALDFASGPVRVWSGLGDVQWDGATWRGVGDLMGISSVEESADVRSNVVTLTLAGVPNSVIDIAMSDAWKNRIARIWFAVFEPDGSLAAEPTLVLRGRMDQLTYSEGETANFALTVETRLADLERPRVRRYTTEDQQQEYPGDRGFDYVESIAAGAELAWGRPNAV